jgi:hypothetical protein
MDFGIFIEELRRGNDAPTWFQETFELVDAAEAWGLDGRILTHEVIPAFR